MSTKKYNTFLKVAELGSITKAAEVLGHTQSGVTQLMHSLETDLGVSLFHRSRSGITLTKQGEELLPYIKEVIDAELKLKHAAKRITTSNQKVLKIGTFTSVAVNWLPAIFQAYKETNPSIRFEMKDIGYNNIEEILKKEDLDVCFVSLPLSLDCKCIPLYQDPLVAVMSKSHKQADIEVCPIRLFETEPVISLIGELNQDAQTVWKENHISPNIEYTTKDDYAMIAMAEKGLGICIMPSLLLQGNEKHIVKLPLDPPAYRTIGIAFPPRKEASPEALKFAEFVASHINI